jgi:hypothetical protein
VGVDAHRRAVPAAGPQSRFAPALSRRREKEAAKRTASTQEGMPYGQVLSLV